MGFLRISPASFVDVDFRTCLKLKNYMNNLHSCIPHYIPYYAPSTCLERVGAMPPSSMEVATAWPGLAPTTPGPRRANSTWGSGASSGSTCTVRPGDVLSV